jgi:hypothetical protein
MFPGKKAGTQYSFGEVKGKPVKEHEVSRPPMKSGHKNCTMSQYSNIEHGETLGERPGKIKHLKHAK